MQFYSNMAAPRTSDLVKEYSEIYQKANLGKKNSHQYKSDIQSFGVFLKKAQKELEGMKSKVETIVDARQGFTQNLSIFVDILDSCTQTLLPDYQKNIYCEYLPEE